MSPPSQNPYKTHRVAELTPELVAVVRASRAGNGDVNVRVAGWLDRKRVLGSLVFLEIRDESGSVQCVVERGSPAFDRVLDLREESVLSVEGRLCLRAAETRNASSPTGSVELLDVRVVVLSEAEVLPFSLRDAASTSEELRLRYRFLDLRRPALHAAIRLRSEVIAHLRAAMTARGFLEIQTPILTASSPEGARDFLVPSRLHPGKFYALPQAPQLFKQLLMTAGFERYFQIAPCFRDEDARADRCPGEFYQLDIEMAFVTEDEIFALVEEVLVDVFQRFGRHRLEPAPFPRIAYRDALRAHGSDKPDLRNPLHFVGVNAWAHTHLDRGVSALALRVPSGASLSRRFIERQVAGLSNECRTAWHAASQPARGAFAHLSAPALAELERLIGALPGDGVLVVTWPREAPIPEGWERVAPALLRLLGEKLGLIDQACYRLCWVVDYPMYEPNPSGGVQFSHNPFSMPQGGLQLLAGDPLSVLAHQYDLVCNGVELSSGAIRNHHPETLLRAFEIAGYDATEVEGRFGGLLRAFRCGAPPHGGLAPGIDRLVRLLTGASNLREVIAFPMTQQAEDLLLGAPSEVSDEQLRAVHIATLGGQARR